MPTYFIFNGLKFFFYSNDHEPIHVHVTKGKDRTEVQAKFSVEPEVRLIENYGLSKREVNKAREYIIEKKEFIIKFWTDFFNQE